MELVQDENKFCIKDDSGKILGEIDFLADQNGKYDIVHTEVDPSLGGQGWAGKLVQAAADYIRSEGKKTSASCSYASRWLQRHKEYDDIYEP